MPPLLLDFARTLAGDNPARPVLAIGLDDAPADDGDARSGIVPVPSAAAQPLLRAAREGGSVAAADLAAAAGVDPATLERAVGLVMPGRTRLWSSIDAADLVELVLAHLSPIVFAARPAGLFQSLEELADHFAARGAAVAFAGCLPPDDDLAPDSPAVVLERATEAGTAPRAVAFVHARNDVDALPGAVRALAEDGIEVVVVDSGSTDGTLALAEGLLGRGVSAVERSGPDPAAPDGAPSRIARLAAASGAPWALVLEADERLAGPWPGVGLRETLGRFDARGHAAARATAIMVEPSSAAPGAIRRWRFSADPTDFRRTVAWRPDAGRTPVFASPRLGGRGPAAPAPYNLLLRRLAPDALAADAAGWAAWDEAEFARRFLVERLTGHGAYRRAHPTPPDLVWRVEERMLDWGGNLLKTGVSRLPVPDPLRPRSGVCLLRWDTADGSMASLWIARPGDEERFAGCGASSTISVEGLQPNRRYLARLYRDDDRAQLLGELRFGFDLAPEPDPRRRPDPEPR